MAHSATKVRAASTSVRLLYVWSPHVQARRCRWCSSDLLPSRPLRTRSSHTSSLSSARHAWAPPRFVLLHVIAANVGICDGDFFIRFRNGAARRGDASRPLWMIGWIRPRGQCHYIRVFYVRTAVQNFQLESLRPRPSIGVSSSCLAGRWSGMAPPRAGRWFSLGWDRNRESGIPTGTLLRNGPYEARNRSPGPRYPG